MILWQEIEYIDVDDVHVQQDGAKCYIQATKPQQFYKKSFLTMLFVEEVITIGHRNLVI